MANEWENLILLHLQHTYDPCDIGPILQILKLIASEGERKKIVALIPTAFSLPNFVLQQMMITDLVKVLTLLDKIIP